jgi:hypothetical protein
VALTRAQRFARQRRLATRARGSRRPRQPKTKQQEIIARGAKRALERAGVEFDSSGRARKNGKLISTKQLEKERTRALQKEKRARPKAPAKKPETKEPTPKPEDVLPKEALEKITSKKTQRLLASLPEEDRRKALIGFGIKPLGKPLKKAEEKERKKKEKELRTVEKERKTTLGAYEQLRKAVKQTNKDSKLWGEYNPKTHKRHKTRGTFGGQKYIPFLERAKYIQDNLQRQFPEDYRRDLFIQSVHIREYLAQGDGGEGRRTIIEKTQNAGRAALDGPLKGRRVYQIYIGNIRVLVREEDAGKYGGYTTRPVSGKRIKAVMDVRGLTGFETVSPGEDPKAALDRILEHLESHLDDILDGLPVVYIKSLQIKFDIEPPKAPKKKKK